MSLSSCPSASVSLSLPLSLSICLSDILPLSYWSIRILVCLAVSVFFSFYLCLSVSASLPLFLCVSQSICLLYYIYPFCLSLILRLPCDCILLSVHAQWRVMRSLFRHVIEKFPRALVNGKSWSVLAGPGQSWQVLISLVSPSDSVFTLGPNRA